MITSHIFATGHLDLLADDVVSHLLQVCDSRTQTEASAKLKASIGVIPLPSCMCFRMAFACVSFVLISYIIRMAYHHPALVLPPESECLGSSAHSPAFPQP